MKRYELLVVHAMEECAELAQRLSKELRFGLTEVQPGQFQSNRERVIGEYADVIAHMELLGIHEVDRALIEAKHVKAEKYLKYSQEMGTVEK